MYSTVFGTTNMCYLYILPVSVPSNSSAKEAQLSQPAEVPKDESQPEQIQNQSEYLDLNEEDLLKAGYQSKKKAWSEEEDRKLRKYYEKDGLGWNQVADLIPGRNAKMCYSRYRRLETQTKMQWKKADDEKLCRLVEQKGENWKQICKHFESNFFDSLERNHKQVKDHYQNYLRPEIRKDEWTLEEDLLLVDLLNNEGKEWKLIEEHFPGRTQNQIKNRYFGRLKKLAQKKAGYQNMMGGSEGKAAKRI